MRFQRIVLMAVLMLGMVLLIGNIAEAQKFQVVQDIYIGKQLVNSGKDSVANLQIPYTGNTVPVISGSFPDSIKFVHACNADSVYAIDLFLRVNFGMTSTADSIIQLDSILSTTKSAKVGGQTLTIGQYEYANSLGIAARARSTGNAVIKATAAKFRLMYIRYFHK